MSSFTVWSIPAFLAGLAIVLAVGSSILRTLVVPRGVRSKLSAAVLSGSFMNCTNCIPKRRFTLRTVRQNGKSNLLVRK